MRSTVTFTAILTVTFKVSAVTVAVAAVRVAVAITAATVTVTVTVTHSNSHSKSHSSSKSSHSSGTSAKEGSLRRTQVPRNCSLILLARSPWGRQVRTTQSTDPGLSVRKNGTVISEAGRDTVRETDR